METRELSRKETEALLSLPEDHFNDLKSKRIAPGKLQESFVAFANSDGGDLYIGIEDKKTGTDRINGFEDQEEANALISILLEETSPAVENVFIEYLSVKEKGLVLHISVPKSPRVHYTVSSDCYIRVNAQKR